MNNNDTSTKIHHGRNIKRFREMFGMKQEALALELGEDWTQKKVSRLEEHDLIEEPILKQVAGILKIPIEAIKNFDEQAAVNYFNSFDHSVINGINNNCTFNPLDKLIEVIEENKNLYERLLAAEKQLLQIEKEKVELLQKQLQEKK